MCQHISVKFLYGDVAAAQEESEVVNSGGHRGGQQRTDGSWQRESGAAGCVCKDLYVPEPIHAAGAGLEQVLQEERESRQGDRRQKSEGKEEGTSKDS